MDFNQKIQIRVSWIAFVTVFLGEIRKKICKTVLVNSGLFTGKNECACETVVLLKIFFSDFPEKRTVGKSKDRFLGVKNRFWMRRFIGNPKSVFKNLNPDFSMETSSLKFGISGFWSLDEPWAVGPQFSREAQDRLEMAPNHKITMCHW